MDVFTAVAERRSIKKFDPAHRMSEDEIRRLMEAAVLSPTSFNLQNWRFVLVADQERKERLRAIGWRQAQFAEASLVILICGDRKAHARDPGRYWRHAPEAARAAIVPLIVGAYEGREDLQHDEVLRSGGMAAQTIMLVAKAMGYDTCPMVGFDFAEAAALVNLPPDHEIVMAVAVGKRREHPQPRGGQLPLEEVVIRERFPDA
ncbi:MAG: nitroreductase family protein [bacterium]|nr:nitroreductase family protein [bacterium]